MIYSNSRPLHKAELLLSYSHESTSKTNRQSVVFSHLFDSIYGLSRSILDQKKFTEHGLVQGSGSLILK